MSRALYKGITLRGYEDNKSLRRRDLSLVKQDLLNHIFTRRSERVMMPLFGTRIPDMLMEPMDESSLVIIQTDLNTVFNYDPRVELLDMQLTPLYEERAVVAIVELRYLELDFSERFDIRLEFEG